MQEVERLRAENAAEQSLKRGMEDEVMAAKAQLTAMQGAEMSLQVRPPAR